MKNLGLLILFAIVAISCSKSTTKNLKAEVFQSSLKPCSCSESKVDDLKMEATIDGKQICFNKLWHPNSVSLDKWMQNSWRSDILTERLSADSSVAIRIEYQFPGFDSAGLLPYQFDSAHHSSCEAILIEIMNLKPFSICECPLSDAYFMALSSTSNLKTTVNSYKDNVIDASFHGDFTNRGGAKFKVSDGHFKIKLQIQK